MLPLILNYISKNELINQSIINISLIIKLLNHHYYIIYI